LIILWLVVHHVATRERQFQVTCHTEINSSVDHYPVLNSKDYATNRPYQESDRTQNNSYNEE